MNLFGDLVRYSFGSTPTELKTPQKQEFKGSPVKSCHTSLNSSGSKEDLISNRNKNLNKIIIKWQAKYYKLYYNFFINFSHFALLKKKQFASNNNQKTIHFNQKLFQGDINIHNKSQQKYGQPSIFNFIKKIQVIFQIYFLKNMNQKIKKQAYKYILQFSNNKKIFEKLIHCLEKIKQENFKRKLLLNIKKINFQIEKIQILLFTIRKAQRKLFFFYSFLNIQSFQQLKFSFSKFVNEKKISFIQLQNMQTKSLNTKNSLCSINLSQKQQKKKLFFTQAKKERFAFKKKNKNECFKKLFNTNEQNTKKLNQSMLKVKKAYKIIANLMQKQYSSSQFGNDKISPSIRCLPDSINLSQLPDIHDSSSLFVNFNVPIFNQTSIVSTTRSRTKLQPLFFQRNKKLTKFPFSSQTFQPLKNVISQPINIQLNQGESQRTFQQINGMSFATSVTPSVYEEVYATNPVTFKNSLVSQRQYQKQPLTFCKRQLCFIPNKSDRDYETQRQATNFKKKNVSANYVPSQITFSKPAANIEIRKGITLTTLQK